MKTLLFTLIAALLLGQAALSQSLWKEDGARANLISDNTSRAKGDIITIVIKESQKVNDKQDVKLEKKSSLDTALKNFNIKPNTFNTLP